MDVKVLLCVCIDIVCGFWSILKCIFLDIGDLGNIIIVIVLFEINWVFFVRYLLELKYNLKRNIMCR